MSRLTDRTNGFVAERLRRRIEGTAAHRVADLETRMARLEHVVAFDIRSFKGIMLETPGVRISPDAHGWLAFSSDGNLAISRDPNKQGNHARFKLTAEIPEPGCTAAITTNIDCQDKPLTATTCGASVQHTSGNGYVAARLSGTGDAQTLSYFWCAPSGDSIPQAQTGYAFPPPDVWAVLTVGDECEGECAEYVFPGFAVGEPK